LDIEGAEYAVLKTVPWEKVNIDALLVEVCNILKPVSLDSMNSSKHWLFTGTVVQDVVTYQPYPKS
jgi:hypothetical protein